MINRPNITKTIAVAAILAAGAIGTGTAQARPLEGGGVPAASCGRLGKFLVGSPGSYPKAKVYAVAGLTGDDADDEFERIQTEITERCS